MTYELTEEQAEYARAAARALPPLSDAELTRLSTLNARDDAAERDRRMQAALVATMGKPATAGGEQ